MVIFSALKLQNCQQTKRLSFHRTNLPWRQARFGHSQKTDEFSLQRLLRSKRQELISTGCGPLSARAPLILNRFTEGNL